MKQQLFPPLSFAPLIDMKAQGHNQYATRTCLGPEAFPILEEEAKIKVPFKKNPKQHALCGIQLCLGKA